MEKVKPLRIYLYREQIKCYIWKGIMRGRNEG